MNYKNAKEVDTIIASLREAQAKGLLGPYTILIPSVKNGEQYIQYHSENGFTDGITLNETYFSGNQTEKEPVGEKIIKPQVIILEAHNTKELQDKINEKLADGYRIDDKGVQFAERDSNYFISVLLDEYFPYEYFPYDRQMISRPLRHDFSEQGAMMPNDIGGVGPVVRPYRPFKADSIDDAKRVGRSGGKDVRYMENNPENIHKLNDEDCPFGHMPNIKPKHIHTENADGNSEKEEN